MSSQTYTQTARWLHWLIAGAIVLQYVLAELAETAAESGSALAQLALLANHKSVGMTILGVALVRLVWRWRFPPPALPAETPGWQRAAAHGTHWGLYLCMFLLPLSGWLMSSASAYSVSWFGLFTLPDLVGPDEALEEQLKLVHEWLANGLFILALLHLGAALKHALWDRDGLLLRMHTWPALAVAIALVVAGIVFLVPAAAPPSTAAPSVQGQPEAEAPVASGIDTSIPAWEVDAAASFIEFTGEQAGAAFTGRWTDWDAQIRFDPERLGQSSAEVIIRTTAVSSNDDERDNTIRGADFFDTANHAAAIFSAASFAQTADGYVAYGELEIKSLRLPLEFQFAVVEEAGVVVLTGTARIDRLAFNVGTGDWQDTTWVGQYVEVRVQVTAS